jgi:hypothetical protein
MAAPAMLHSTVAASSIALQYAQIKFILLMFGKFKVLQFVPRQY